MCYTIQSKQCYLNEIILSSSLLLLFFRIQKAQLDYEIDFTDWPYQQKLPFHARSTVSKSLKNNIRNSEINTDPNLNLNAGRVRLCFFSCYFILVISYIHAPNMLGLLASSSNARYITEEHANKTRI